jgi:hypothetical protein
LLGSQPPLPIPVVGVVPALLVVIVVFLSEAVLSVAAGLLALVWATASCNKIAKNNSNMAVFFKGLVHGLCYKFVQITFIKKGQCYVKRNNKNTHSAYKLKLNKISNIRIGVI